MDKKDTITLTQELEKFANQPAPTNTALEFPNIPPKDYDIELLTKFLDTVFHAGIDDDENILTWMVNPNAQPAYPKSEGQLFEKLAVTRKAQALYFNTATCKREDNKLRARKALFYSLRLIVLDDIGTKIPLDKIPKDFPPSYIIETSKGNFQYGYIFKEPIDTLGPAEAIIQLVYEAGYSDEGGKTAVKLVRLPDGVNGKKGEKGGFISKLVSLTDITYTPQEIFDHLNLNVNWDEVLEDPDNVTKRRASKSLGTTPWADVTPKAQALNGYIDPVLEYLYETGQVSMDNQGPWVEIKCPWNENHTTGESTAGYAPIGRGDNVDNRGFHCFHDSCSGTNTAEFLKYIATVSGIQAGIHDPAAKLTTRYVFDKTGGTVWDIKTFRRDIKIAMSSFVVLHPHKTTVQTVDGKEKLVGMTSLWSTSPSRVVVAGATYDPSTTARLVENGGEKYVNLFSIPEWGHGPIDMDHVKKFKDFLEYLIPDQLSRDYFLTWLAAKCQDMSFRGAAILMVAVKQGVGRSTMADMIKTLVGSPNVADVPLPIMVGGSAFNEWQEKPFIVSEETLSADPKLQFNTYEKLKTFIDPRSRTVTINPKFGMKREVATHASYLFLSNHINAISIPATDRRFFVLENAHDPAPPAFFTALNEWLEKKDSDGLPSWGRSVYRWLQTIEFNMEDLTAPPPRTQAKIDMSGACESDLDFTVRRLLALWPDMYINSTEVFTVFEHPLLAGPLHFDEDTTRKFIRRMINVASVGYKVPIQDLNGSGKTIKPRLLKTALVGFVPFSDKTRAGIEKTRLAVQAHYNTRVIDYDAMASTLADELYEDDRT